MPNWAFQYHGIGSIPRGQYVDKNNYTQRVRDGKEWERTGKPLKSLGGCNFRKGNYLRFCRESVSQCGGQGFDPPLLHQNPSILNNLQDRSKGLELPNDQYVTKFFCLKLRLPFESVARRVNQLLVIYMRSNTLSAT